MGGRNRKKRSEAVHALVFFWLQFEGRMGLEDLILRLEEHNKRFNNVRSLSQQLKPMVSKQIIVKVSEHPNPEYEIHPRLLPP
jgi:hypothetical protein